MHVLFGVDVHAVAEHVPDEVTRIIKTMRKVEHNSLQPIAVSVIAHLIV